MQQPLFSLITPTYNRGYRLWKTILSIQAQELADWELIVVDDGSTDDTAKVMAQFQADQRIRYQKTSNRGPGAARNEGLNQVRGRYISYIDSDDPIYPHYLRVAHETFTKDPGAIFMVPNYNRRIELVDQDQRVIDFTEVSSAQKLTVTMQDLYHWKVKTCGTGIFHTRHPIEDGIRWDTTLATLEDLDFLMQLAVRYPDGFRHIPFVLFTYAQQYAGDGVCSSGTYTDWADGFERVYQKHKHDPLMAGQDWYPSRVKKYRQLQLDFDAGKAVPPAYRYFPDHFFKKETGTSDA